jgi:hypothetical protein
MNKNETQNIEESEVVVNSPIRKHFFTVTPLSKFLAMALFVLLPFFGFWVGMSYDTEGVVSEIGKDVIEEEVVESTIGTFNAESREFASNFENIKLTLPKGWSPVTVSSLEPYSLEFGEVLFAFEKENSKCLILYASYPREGLGGRDLVSFVDTPNTSPRSKDWTFGSRWYVDGQDVEFSDFERQYIDGEFRSSSMSRRGPKEFVLLKSDGSSVQDECSRDMDALFGTVLYHYETAPITNKSDGILWVTKEWSFDRSRMGVSLVFSPSDSQNTYKVEAQPENIDRFTVLVNDGLFYYVATNDVNDSNEDYERGIRSYDVFTGVSSDIASTFTKNSWIVDMLINDGHIYYIRGIKDSGNCSDTYRNVCKGDLYKTSIEDGSTTHIASDIRIGDISGYANEEEALYFVRGSVDGNCSSAHYSKIVNGEVIYLGGWSGPCPAFNEPLDEDEGIEGDPAEFEWLAEKFLKTESAAGRGVHVQRGSLTPLVGLPPYLGDRNADATFYFGE